MKTLTRPTIPEFNIISKYPFSIFPQPFIFPNKRSKSFPIRISFIVLWEYLNKGGKYIIEDVDKRILNGIASWEELFEDCKCEKIYGHDNDIQGFVCFTKL